MATIYGIHGIILIDYPQKERTLIGTCCTSLLEQRDPIGNVFD